MSHRKFQDRDGNGWEVRAESKHRWTFAPLRGNDAAARTVRPPLYAEDPFELSQKELQRMLDGSAPTRTGAPKRSIFKEDA